MTSKALIILLIFLISCERVPCQVNKFKTPESDQSECTEKIIQTQELIIRTFGENRGNELIKSVKSAPDQYLNDDIPIIVELAELFVQDALSGLSTTDLYREILQLKSEKELLTRKVEEFENKINIQNTKTSLSWKGGVS